MIRFFRQLRQRLLSENHLVRYLLYASGEIFLVVIGILLALQINNWNEWRKDREREQKILKSLEENLQRNIIILSDGIKVVRDLNNSSKIVFDFFDEKIVYQDSLYTHFRLGRRNGVMQGLLSSEGYENYKNAGFDIILSDTIKSSVLYLFEVEYPNQEAYRQLLLEGNNRDYMGIMSKYFSRTKVIDIRNLLNASDAYEMYFDVNMFRSQYEGRLSRTLENTEKTLQLITDKLTKK